MPRIFISPQNKIGYFFVGATVALLVAALSTLGLFKQKLEITIYAAPEKINTSFLLAVKQENSEMQGDIDGKIIQISKEASFQFKPEKATALESYAEGEVYLYNDTNKGHKIIAASRLESPEGLIFRLKSPVWIPAKSRVKVEVKADKKGKKYELKPTTFTLPGLKGYPALYQKIYAKNEKPFSGGTKDVKIVRKEDLDAAKSELQETLEALCLEDLKLSLPESGYRIIKQNKIIEFHCNAKTGEEKEKFSCSGKNILQVVAIKKDILLQHALQELKASLARGEKLIKWDQSPDIKIKDYQAEKRAILQVKAQGETFLTEENPYLDKNEIVNLKPQEIKEYLKKINSIENVELSFSPFFFKKTPKWPENIKIKIIQNE